LVQHWPLGAWGLASAALVLVALGAAIWVEMSDGAVRSPAAPTVATGTGASPSIRIVEDPSMALFHDVETFDEVGLLRGEVIADWGR